MNNVADPGDDAPPAPSIGALILVGGLLAATGLGGFGGWAAMAPLASAAVAPGVVAADSNRKTIQHLDGGIVADIMVRDGDRVEAGQPLMRLDDLETRSTVALLEGQLWALLAQEARLLAERDGLDAIRFPETLTSRADDPATAGIMAGQERIFATRRDGLQRRREVAGQRSAQLQAQIAGLTAQREAGKGQLALIREETEAIAEMVAHGLERKPRLLGLMRQATGLEGQQGDLANRIAQAGEAIVQAEFELLSQISDRQSEVAAELRNVQTRRDETEEKLAAARIRQHRRDVTAPEAGTVMNSRFFAPGAVAAPGAAILDLVPLDDRLVIEARINPTDIDVVRAGLTARVTLSAFHGRTTPKLDGSVARVSADALHDDRSGMAYYLARVEVDADQLRALKHVRLQPGMPVETLIETGERTLLRYLIQPLEDSLRRAFRED